jgi:hypothetical protein
LTFPKKEYPSAVGCQITLSKDVHLIGIFREKRWAFLWASIKNLKTYVNFDGKNLYKWTTHQNKCSDSTDIHENPSQKTCLRKKQ